MKNKKVSLIKKLLVVLIAIIVIPILVINLTIIVKQKVNPDKIPDFMGYKPFVVLSGSMETKIHVGDLVVVKITDPAKINKGDVIAFRNEKIVITHRVVKVIKDGNEILFKTKGDNNNTEDDSLVHANELEGKYVFKMSNVGNIFMFLSKPTGMLIVILIIIVCAGLIYYVAFKPTKEEKKLMEEFEEFKKAKEKEKD